MTPEEVEQKINDIASFELMNSVPLYKVITECILKGYTLAKSEQQAADKSKDAEIDRLTKLVKTAHYAGWWYANDFPTDDYIEALRNFETGKITRQ